VAKVSLAFWALSLDVALTLALASASASAAAATFAAGDALAARLVRCTCRLPYLHSSPDSVSNGYILVHTPNVSNRVNVLLNYVRLSFVRTAQGVGGVVWCGLGGPWLGCPTGLV